MKRKRFFRETKRTNIAVKKMIRHLGCSVRHEWGPSGNCPVQACGTLCLPNKKWVSYYFRARHTHWSMEFGTGENSVVYREKYSDEKYAAGWMDVVEALRFMHQAIVWYKDEQKAPAAIITTHH